MEQTLKGKSFGSLIGLKNNAAEPYILLHQYTFPPVLNRIARSNIANYSIFLLDGLLFGFYDYLGSDHDVDMAAMAGDHDTVQWWKLTEPMQQPLPGRKPGEWWASMIHLRSLKHDAGIERGITRKAFRLENSPGLEEEPGKWLPDHGGIIIRSELFSYNADLFLYIETNPESAAKVGEILAGNEGSFSHRRLSACGAQKSVRDRLLRHAAQRACGIPGRGRFVRPPVCLHRLRRQRQ
jgi:L-rhamnose mutarotase